MIIKGGAGAQAIGGTAGNDIIYGYDPSGVSSVTVTPVVTSGLSQPLYATYAPGDANGLYVVEKGGEITRYDKGTGLSTTLSISDVSTGGERGVLGMVFHPDYAANGRFFVYVTAADGNVEVREYSRNGANGTIASATEDGVILEIEHSSAEYHNGGSMAFGPDGLLYIAVGDAQDEDNSQNGANLLGKILRIDVSNTNFGGAGPYYQIPPANVFANPSDSAAGEIFAMGLRNPWRMSFDAAGNLWIGDVGENDYEEVNFVAAGSNGGMNFGWPIREGTQPFAGGTPGPGVLTNPLHQYSHAIGQSITGGFVYDGPAPALQGKYIFGDFVTGKIFALERAGGTASVTEITSMLSTPIGGGELASFGLDAQHNLYAVKFSGEVVLLTPQPTANDGNDTLAGGAGRDYLFGGDGDDRLYGESGNDALYGGNGSDVLDGGIGSDGMAGAAGDDFYFVDNNGDVIIEGGGGGIDRVISSITYTLGANLEILTLAGAADLDASGNALANVLNGNIGNNYLRGYAANDALYGFAGDDILDGGIGADAMAGGAGSDFYFVDNLGDVVTETGGDLDRVASSITYTLGANLDILTLAGVMNIHGAGNALGNVLNGNAGGNFLNGAGGNDHLNGFAGNDVLVGGTGSDRLSGGLGADAFVFNTAPGAGQIDTITDFNVADDTIRLENSIFTALGAAGVLNAAQFQIGAAADANDRIIYNASTGALFYDSNGNNAGGAVQFATLSAGLALTNQDFLII